MAAEAYPSALSEIFERGHLTLASAAEPGDVLQYYDGRACYVEAVDDLASGDKATVVLRATHVELPFTASVAAVRGMPVWWDESANKVIAQPGLSVGDFFLGICAEDKAGVATTGMRAKVNLGQQFCPQWSLKDGSVDGVADAIVETNGLGVTRLSGGQVRLAFDATSEAATASVLSGHAIPVADNVMFYGVINLVADGDAAIDYNFGLANAGHATDADSITESVFVHIDAGSANILLESDDGTTEVAAEDSTKDVVAGTPFTVWIDTRAPADIQIYLDGINVKPTSSYKLDAATGPIKALVHVEKTANDATCTVDVLAMAIFRVGDQAA